MAEILILPVRYPSAEQTTCLIAGLADAQEQGLALGPRGPHQVRAERFWR